jgi:hypothetical protein
MHGGWQDSRVGTRSFNLVFRIKRSDAPGSALVLLCSQRFEHAMAVEHYNRWLPPDQEFPPTSGSYLVLIREDATSEYFPDFQVVYYDKYWQQFRTEVYQPDDGTMEPRDITNVVIAWYHLPSRLKSDSTSQRPQHWPGSRPE